MTKDRYLFRGFHECENGKETIYIDGQAIKGKWVEGYYSKTDLGMFINQYRVDYEDECTYCEDFEVIPETIGQCVGLSDKNGKLIFENDVVRYDSGFGGYETSKIFYDEYRLSLNFKTDFGYNYSGIWELRNKKNIEIIRTKFDKEVKDNEYQ